MKSRGDVFVEHIEEHLEGNDDVMCKICGKTVDEIFAERMQASIPESKSKCCGSQLVSKPPSGTLFCAACGKQSSVIQ